MDSIPYVDELIKEYLLFRGYVKTFTTLNVERTRDPANQPEVGLLADELLRAVRETDYDALSELWRTLDSRYFRQLAGEFGPALARLRTSLWRAYLVSCSALGRREKMAAFFQAHAAELTAPAADTSAPGGSWATWFSLPYVRDPASHPHFQAYFSEEWQRTFAASVRNFLNSVFQEMPLPKLLAFNIERHERRATYAELRSLRSEVQRLRQELDAVRGGGRHAREAEAEAGAEAAGGPDKDAAAEAAPAADADAGAKPSSASSPAEEADQQPAPGGQFDVQAGRDVLELGGHAGPVTRCRFSPDGQRFASAGRDGTVRIWSVSRPLDDYFGGGGGGDGGGGGEERAEPEPPLAVYATSEVLSLSWDSRRDNLLAFGNSTSEVRVYDAREQKVVCELSAGDECPRVLDVAPSPADALLVVASAGRYHDSLEGGMGQLATWSMQTGQRVSRFQIEASRTQINSVAVNHNGNMLMAAGADGMVRVFDVQTGTPIMGWPAHEGQVSSVRFSADETTVVSAGLDGQIVEWSLHRIGKRLRTFALPRVESFQRWPVTRCDLALDHRTAYLAASCAPAGRAPLVYALGDGAGGAPPQALPGHAAAVASVDWHPSKDFLLTGAADHTVRLVRLRRP